MSQKSFIMTINFKSIKTNYRREKKDCLLTENFALFNNDD
jgi:hypothetical protein